MEWLQRWIVRLNGSHFRLGIRGAGSNIGLSSQLLDVSQVQDKFFLNLNDEEAVQHMQHLIDESMSATMAVFVEKVHNFAQVSISSASIHKSQCFIINIYF